MKPLDHETRAILDEGTSADSPAPGAEQRIWQELAGRLGAPLPPMASAAEAALSGGAGSGGWLGLGATSFWIGGGTLGVLLGTGLVWYTRVDDAGAAAEARARASQPPAYYVAAPSGVEPVELAAPPSTGPVTPPASRGPAAQPASEPLTSGLLDETRLISDAQRALSTGSPARALTALERHRARFPDGALVQEREAARVLAFCALGRGREAQRVKQSFVKTWPTSPLAARVRAACARQSSGER